MFDERIEATVHTDDHVVDERNPEQRSGLAQTLCEVMVLRTRLRIP